MPAFDRESDMQVVGLQASLEAIGDETSEIIQEVSYADTTIDALVTRIDEDSLEEREALGLDEPLLDEHRGIYEWFTRVGKRDSEDLFHMSPDEDYDRELVNDLREVGFLKEYDGGRLSAVDIPRHLELVAIEFATAGWREKLNRFYKLRTFTDEQRLIVDSEVATEVTNYTRWFKTNGVGLAALSPDGILTTIIDPTGSDLEDERIARALAEDVYAGEVA
ncbi:hypothetical protein [Halomontanus rarus]|uniref:hypothetical protein n=1 Tax=Halomontanus rarus TaxID=3034020 RepID=UPI00293BD446|nr:hypothetical protein [Halovivax sp. KZCA124]